MYVLHPRLLNGGPRICQKLGCKVGGSEFHLSKYSYQRMRRAMREKRKTLE